MSVADDRDFVRLSDRKDEEGVDGEPSMPTTSASDSACVELGALCSTEDISRVLHSGSDGSAEATIVGDVKDVVCLEIKKEDGVVGDASAGGVENQATASVSAGNEGGEAMVEVVKFESGVEDYDSMLFEFDRFVYKAGDEAVGFGYEIGDIVWGKVKSHPWWPGQIFNEVLASPSVRKLKREGHVLVAFFGDNSYGWFDPKELAPFAGCFHEKLRQSSSRAFLKAVEEAMDEISRRASLGLACRCRNEFNFWPFSIEGYFTVYAGDYEPGVYSASQIKRSRNDFRPSEMLYFIRNLALRPFNNDLRTIESVKSKAIALAYRKALFEEFDDTYAQAFGTIPQRPPRPTAPVAVDPSWASLSGRLVFAEALDNVKLSTTPNQASDPAKEEKIVSKSLDVPANMKQKNVKAEVSVPLPDDVLGSSGTRVDSNMKVHVQQSGLQAQASVSGQIKTSEGFRLLSEGRKKKAKVVGEHAAVASPEQASLAKKRKKEANTQGPSLGKGSKKRKKKENFEVPFIPEESNKRKKDASCQGPVSEHGPPPITWVKKKRSMVIRKGVTTKRVSHMNFAEGHVPKAAQMSCDGLDHGSFPVAGPQQDAKSLAVALRDLRVVALDPFHGVDSGVSANMRLVLMKYRSLVFQKSLALPPPHENKANEVHLPDSTTLHKPAYKSTEKSTIKHAQPADRRDDLTSGGKKPTRTDQPEVCKKKKLDDSKDVYFKKPAYSGDKDRKKLMNDSKSLSIEKKIPHQTAAPQRRDAREAPPRNVLPNPPKSLKRDSGHADKPVKVRQRTALIMKFPKDAALPSVAELAARFARFGQLEYTSTRLYWQTYTCRVVFQYKVDAEAALKFASSSENLFGYENVFCHLKDAASDGAEPETTKLRKADPVTRSAVPLKSCLKKPSNEEKGSGNGNGNGRGGTRVKFLLDDDGGASVEQNSVTPTTHSSYSMDLSSENVVASLNPQPILAGQASQHQIPKFPAFVPPEFRPFAQMPVDISGELLSLLNRCRDVVNSVTGVLGYVPYHPL